MTGMDAVTGKPLTGLDHLRQSIADILSTPIGARIGRRNYGSLLPDLIDQPMNAAGRMRLIAATALALLRWEPRIRLTNVAIHQTAPGAFSVAIEGVRTDARLGARASLTIPLTYATA